jgi:hypothetical protein
VIAIHLDESVPGLENTLPKELDGCPTKFVHSGPFRKLGGG